MKSNRIIELKISATIQLNYLKDRNSTLRGWRAVSCEAPYATCSDRDAAAGVSMLMSTARALAALVDCLDIKAL